MPKFSVIIPLYNKAQNIEATLRSVLSQTFTDFEIIIVNDGSTDNSLSIAEQIHDDRIKIYNKDNEGVSKTRNYGALKAKTDYLTFLDADDIWYNHHLKTLDDLVTTYPNHKWFATAYEKKYSSALTLPMESHLEASFEGEIVDYFKQSMIDSLAWTSAVCMRADFFKTLKGFDTTVAYDVGGEDVDLWIRAALASPLIFTQKITAQYNMEGVNRISTISIEKRMFCDLDQYEDAAKGNPSLKRYLDTNRFAIGLQYKIAGDTKNAASYFDKINLDLLNKKQRFLIKVNRNALPLFISIQNKLRALNINLSSFK